MEEISKSRLLKNLWRDLNNNFIEDENLSIMNESGREFEVTDLTTGITKIVYPRSVFHTERPKVAIRIRQKANDDDENYIYDATITRKMLKRRFVSVDTPIKYRNEVGNFSEILSINWVNKMLLAADKIIITPYSMYIIYNYNEKNTNDWITLLVLIFILSVIVMALIII